MALPLAVFDLDGTLTVTQRHRLGLLHRSHAGRDLFEPVPGARELVSHLVETGWLVYIATGCLGVGQGPRAERLRQAGVAVVLPDFADLIAAVAHLESALPPAVNTSAEIEP